jgi:prepilin peptidase CpaA
MTFNDSEIVFWGLILISMVASFTDLWKGKIYNWLTLPAVVSGIIFSAFLGGGQAMAFSILAIILAFFLYGWLFFFRVLGAGDVKFLMALGAWGGVSFAFSVSLLGILIAGVFAFFLLIGKGKMRNFWMRVQVFLFSVSSKEIETVPLEIDQKNRMAFGPALAIAVIWLLLDDPFLKIGVRLPWH